MVLHHKWWEKELNDIGLNKLQTPILGSARYCNEWIEKINEILPSDSSLKNLGKDKLKVLYMDLPHYKEYNPKFSQELINQILSLNFTYTIVKPQTRSNKMTFETNEKVYIANDENSVNLIKWADVVIVLFSSILLEVLIQKKVFLYPKYMHNHEMIHEQYNASWELNSQEELIEALIQLNNKPNDKPYDQKAVNEFIKSVVYNGPTENVLHNYKNYIFNIEKEFLNHA